MMVVDLSDWIETSSEAQCVVLRSSGCLCERGGVRLETLSQWQG